LGTDFFIEAWRDMAVTQVTPRQAIAAVIAREWALVDLHVRREIGKKTGHKKSPDGGTMGI
jgi:hypothetical protein